MERIGAGGWQVAKEKIRFLELVAAPVDVVGEDAEADLGVAVPEMLDGPGMVIRGEALGGGKVDVVAASDVEGNRGLAPEVFLENQRFLGKRQVLEVEFLAQLGFNRFEIERTLEESDQEAVVGQLMKRGIRSGG